MTNQYTILREKHQKLVHNFPFGFAYNDKQFEEMMKNWGLTPDDTDKIYQLSNGTFYLRKDSDRLVELMDQMERETAEAIAGDKTGDGFIYDMFREELSNHEYCITLDLDPTLDELGLTIEEINADKRLIHGLCKAEKDYLQEMREGGWF